METRLYMYIYSGKLALGLLGCQLSVSVSLLSLSLKGIPCEGVETRSSEEVNANILRLVCCCFLVVSVYYAPVHSLVRSCLMVAYSCY